MENRSRHYGDVKLWIEKVIDSCETMEHVRTTEKLITNFDKSSQISLSSLDTLGTPNEMYALLSDKKDQIFNKNYK